jgi:5-methylcytosine-specific restriction endonuclease McrA
MFVLAEFESHEILPLLGLDRPAILMATRNGFYHVKVGTVRLECLKRNQVCVRCGLVGTRFRLERSVMADTQAISCMLGDGCPWCSIHPRANLHMEGSPHLNLYGFKTNEQGVVKSILMTRDHVHPRSKGGSNTIENQVTLCSPCNEKKGNLLPDQMVNNATSGSFGNTK